MDLLSNNSTKPLDPNLVSCSTIPKGFTIAEIPLLAALIIYLPFSIDLNIPCENVVWGL